MPGRSTFRDLHGTPVTPHSSHLTVFLNPGFHRGGSPAPRVLGMLLACWIGSVIATGIGGLAWLGGGIAAGQESPRVAASIRPVHSLVAEVMAGVGAPHLLARRGGSPHGQALRPSAARVLSHATVVFWIGEELEGYLAKPLRTLAANAKVVTLARSEGIRLLKFRKAGIWTGKSGAAARGNRLRETREAVEDNRMKGNRDREEAAGHGEYNPHIWLDPRHGAAMAGEIAKTLAEVDPDRAGVYRRNAERLAGRLVALEKELEILLAPVAQNPFVAYHGAYAYFEQRFGLNGMGIVTVNPEYPLGARRAAAIRRGMREGRAVCLFREPWTPRRSVAMLVENTGARVGVIDPLGTNLEPGAGLYFAMLRSLARGFSACLGKR